MTVGMVWLVGAGPGDRGLITVAAAERLATAEVVVYDRLVDPALLKLAPPDAERISVGKEAGHHSLPQDEINALLVAKAREGKRVVRLKGGDPFVFGRGGEEAETLVAAGIPFAVVPGVSSAIAVPAYAGIPLTHRGVASSFAVVTGHEDPSKDESDVDWQKLATAVDTIVILMGGANLGDIVERLIAGGRDPSTPVAVIRWGTTSQQRTVHGTLADIAKRVAEAGLTPPVVTVVGQVTTLNQSLRWFDTRPLFGLRVLVTRAEGQATELSTALRELGADPIELPAIEIEPRPDRKRLRATLDRLDNGGYDWAVFTSANGVDVFFQFLTTDGKDARALGWSRVCAIGPGTAAALARHGIVADLLPERFIAEGIVEALGKQRIMGNRILWVRARGARRTLALGLMRLGAEVEELPLYRAVPPREVDAEAMRRLRDGEIDVVTFASPSAVRNLAKMLGGDTSMLAKARIACIGPVTARAARKLGLRVDIEAPEHTVAGLVSDLCRRQL
jgi:uroporphyrinogen III methyltransferase/synthase